MGFMGKDMRRKIFVTIARLLPVALVFVGASSPQTGGRSSEPFLSIAELIDNVKAQGELHTLSPHTADVFGFAKESLPVLTVIAGRAQISVTSLDNQTSVMLADEVEPSSGRRD
jgi:hypothetical protein